MQTLRTFEHSFVEPQWYDAAHNHILVLLKQQRSENRQQQQQQQQQRTSQIRLQIKTIPAHNGSILRTLSFEPIVVPRHVVVLEKATTTVRVPLSVRLSLDFRLVAWQESESLVRIFKVKLAPSAAAIVKNSTPDNALAAVTESAKASKRHQQHWVINLALGDPNPIVIDNGSNHNNNSNNLHATTTPNTPSRRYSKRKPNVVLRNGIIWSDHGARRSQDLLLVTNKAIYCYKISTNKRGRSDYMSLTHTLTHPDAKACWYDHRSRVCVVGAYGPPVGSGSTNSDTLLYASPYFLYSEPRLNNSRHGLALPRLELPAPDKMAVFAVNGNDESTASMSSSSSNNIVRIDEIELVNLYNVPTLVHVKFVSTAIGGILLPQIVVKLYTLSRKHKRQPVHTVLLSMPQSQYSIVPRRSVTKRIMCVVENVLCITLTRLKFHVFVDVQKWAGEASFLAYTQCYSSIIQPHITCDDTLDFGHKAQYVLPSILYDPSNSSTTNELIQVGLNIQAHLDSLQNSMFEKFAFMAHRSTKIVYDKLMQELETLIRDESLTTQHRCLSLLTLDKQRPNIMLTYQCAQTDSMYVPRSLIAHFALPRPVTRLDQNALVSNVFLPLAKEEALQGCVLQTLVMLCNQLQRKQHEIGLPMLMLVFALLHKFGKHDEIKFMQRYISTATIGRDLSLVLFNEIMEHCYSSPSSSIWMIGNSTSQEAKSDHDTVQTDEKEGSKTRDDLALHRSASTISIVQVMQRRASWRAGMAIRRNNMNCSNRSNDIVVTSEPSFELQNRANDGIDTPHRGAITVH